MLRKPTGDNPLWAFSPDGKWLALSGVTDAGIELLDERSGTRFSRTRQCTSTSQLEFATNDELLGYADNMCRFHVPDLKPLRKAPASAHFQGRHDRLPAELAVTLEARYCFDGRVVFPSEFRPCTP